jgi:hypothetical protein
MSEIITENVSPEEFRDTIIDWRNTVDQIIAAYRIAPRKGLIHGLQKDAIQNSWDAKAIKKGKGCFRFLLLFQPPTII